MSSHQTAESLYMRNVISILILVLASFASISAYADNMPSLRLRAVIVNLTLMPIEQAIAFCDERNLDCPAIREKAEEEKKRLLAENNVKSF